MNRRVLGFGGTGLVKTASFELMNDTAGLLKQLDSVQAGATVRVGLRFQSSWRLDRKI
jgi:hypothetical protein